ncbi:MAG: GIN domain-containing protein, partial [Vitreimonas sp.]
MAAGLAAAPALAQTPPAQPAPHPAPAAHAWQRFAEAHEVQLRDVAAIVRITPENRTDIALAIANGGPLRGPEVRVRGERLLVDGKLRRQIRSCRVRGQDFEVTTARNGRLSGGELPVIDLRVPQSAVVHAGGAVRLHMGPSQSARVRLDGCGEADIERVADAADIAVAGGPDVRLYEAGTATVSVAGAGDVVLGVVREGLTASIAG